MRKRSAENKEKVAARTRAWRQRNPKYMLHAAAKRRSRDKDWEFDLIVDDIPDIPLVCPIAQIPIHAKELATRGPCENSPTLDRIDTTKGYVKGNLRVISFKGNRWKSDMTILDVIHLLEYMGS